VTSTPPPSRPRRRVRRAALQLLAAAAFLLLLEGVLALAGVQPVADSDDPYVGFSAGSPLFEREAGPDGTDELVTAPGKLKWFNPQRFPALKAPGTFRVFTLGGSTTYGHPFDDAVSYSGWLRELLPAVDPGRRFEVINCGGISYASYREVVLLKELLQYSPDVVIVYCGPNEFLEARTYGDVERRHPLLLRLGSLLSRTRLYTLARSWLRDEPATLAANPGDRDGATTVLPAEVTTRLDDPAGLALYERDDALRAQILEHYRYNLGRMAELAAGAGARLLLVAPASELRDCAPFKSQHTEDVTDETARHVEDLLAQAEQELRESTIATDLAPRFGLDDPREQALALATEAASADPRYALAHYRCGEALFALGRPDEARAAFERARDEDVCPLRPLTEMRAIVLDTAREQGTLGLDFVSVVDEDCERRFGHRVPGHEQFLDHVHLDVEGYRLLALALLSTLQQAGLVAPPADVGNAAAAARVDPIVRGRLDPAAEGQKLRNLAKTLGWAGKYDEAARLAQQTLQVLGDGDSESHFLLGSFASQAGRWDEAVEHYLQAVAIDPGYLEAHVNLSDAAIKAGRPELAQEHLRAVLAIQPENAQAWNVLGLLLDQQGDAQAALEHFDRAVQLAPTDPRVHLNRALALLHLSRPDDAQAELEQAVRLDPAYAKAHFNLGLLLVKRGRTADGSEHLRRALEIDPGYAEARAALESLPIPHS
jgi:tetratricopeptide (TPR) repeat protein